MTSGIGLLRPLLYLLRQENKRKVSIQLCLYPSHSCWWQRLTPHFLFQVGNLSFYTTEEQIYELFSKCASPEDGGGVKRIIMGLDRNTRCVIPHLSQLAHAY